MALPGEFLVFAEHDTRVWVRIERVLRVHIQHDPESKTRATASLIYKGFSWIQSAARNAGYSEVIFESKAPSLIRFVKKLFGFEPVEANYHVRNIRGTEEHSGTKRQFLQ